MEIENNLTPLEWATKITINTPNDIILGWEGASKLIYCYKNDKDLIEWLSLLSDEFIENCVDKRFGDLNDHYGQDFLQIGLYLNMMKKRDWSLKVSEDDIVKTINQILVISISCESINRKVMQGVQKEGITLPGSGKLINMSRKQENKYDFSSYAVQANPEINFVDNSKKKGKRDSRK